MKLGIKKLRIYKSTFGIGGVVLILCGLFSGCQRMKKIKIDDITLYCLKRFSTRQVTVFMLKQVGTESATYDSEKIAKRLGYYSDIIDLSSID